MRAYVYQRAFTILELLVAACVFMIMATLLLTMMSQANSAWQHADGQKNRREVGRALVDLISRDLQGAIPPLSGVGTNAVNFELAPGVVGLPSSSCLFWQTRVPMSRGRSDVATVGYYVGAKKELFRAYANRAVPDIISQAEGFSAVNGHLADNVIRMGVTLFNLDGSSTSNSAVYATNLPSSVEVTLAIADGRTLRRNPGLTVPDFNNPPQGVQVFRSRIDLPCSQ